MWQALLEGSPYGEAAVVEVADELWVNGAAELSHLPVSGGDEDALDTLHQDVVEQGVLSPRGQSDGFRAKGMVVDFTDINQIYTNNDSSTPHHLLHGVIHLLCLPLCQGLLQGPQVERVWMLHPGNLVPKQQNNIIHYISI